LVSKSSLLVLGAIGLVLFFGARNVFTSGLQKEVASPRVLLKDIPAGPISRTTIIAPIEAKARLNPLQTLQFKARSGAITSRVFGIELRKLKASGGLLGTFLDPFGFGGIVKSKSGTIISGLGPNLPVGVKLQDLNRFLGTNFV